MLLHESKNIFNVIIYEKIKEHMIFDDYLLDIIENDKIFVDYNRVIEKFEFIKNLNFINTKNFKVFTDSMDFFYSNKK